MTASASPPRSKGECQREREVYRRKRKTYEEARHEIYREGGQERRERERESRRRTGRSVFRGELIRCLLSFIQPITITLDVRTRGCLHGYESHYHTKSIHNIAKLEANRSRYPEECTRVFRRISPLRKSMSPNRCGLAKAHLRDLSIILKSFPFGNYAKWFLSFPRDKVFAVSTYP
jgi:hypothetical protein